MKPLFVGEQDYYAACLHRLEETRGHLLNEDEYSAVRKELLEELATCTSRRGHVLVKTAAALAGCIAGLMALLFVSNHPALLCVASLMALACGGILVAMSNRKDADPGMRLAMLDSAREHRLVSDEEFARVHSRLAKA